jgi:hypothetical protein
MTVKQTGWNEEYATRFSPPTKIPTVFIDPVYDEVLADENEKKINKNQTDTLWNLLTDPTREEFNCDKRCKAPQGFFSGQPWLLEDEAQKKRLEDRTSIKWQIWFADCDGTGTKSYTIKHESEGGQTTLLYQLKDEDNTTTIDSFLFPNMTVENETGEKLKTITLTLDILADEHFGTYFIENEKGVSNQSQIIKVVDGEWEDFGPFGDCSKACIENINDPLGIRRRERQCKPPQNGGRPCLGATFEEHECAHPPGDKGHFNHYCPVDARWSAWSEWTRCSANCITASVPLPEKSRSRICQQEKHGGKSCDVLERITKGNAQPLMEERQNCTELPKCPIPATLGPWNEWSACTKTCYDEGTAQPQRTRNRTCKKEVITDPTLGISVATCESLGKVDDILPCEIGFCPVDPIWRSWTAWTPCSATCGFSGMRRRDRGYTPGRNGADQSPKVGLAEEEEPCNRKKCPVPAKWTWSEWSSCDINCYEPDGYRGVRERQHHCKEGTPKHEFLNCNNPPWGESVDRRCPDIKECASLTRVRARVADEWLAGTDCHVQLVLRNRGTSEECQTKTLDKSGSNWERNQEEDYEEESFSEQFLPCKHFYPKPGKLQFYSTCRGSGKLASLVLNFGSTSYSSRGLEELSWDEWGEHEQVWHDLH